MPIEFIQESQPTGSSSDTARLVMMYDGSGRRISKTLLTKSAAATSWDTVKVTHYTGIGTEACEAPGMEVDSMSVILHNINEDNNMRFFLILFFFVILGCAKDDEIATEKKTKKRTRVTV